MLVPLLPEVWHPSNGNPRSTPDFHLEVHSVVVVHGII